MTAQFARPARPAGSARPALLAVAHGSRDPRHAAALGRLLDAVRRARPGLRAELGFLDLCGPDVPSALRRLVESGDEVFGGIAEVIVLPLFLSHGYHVGHDIPAVTAQARRAVRRPPLLTVAEPLGPDPLLDAAMDRRLREQGVYGPAPAFAARVVTTPAVAADPALRSAGVPGPGPGLGLELGLELVVASATSPPAATVDAVSALRARGASRIAVASYFLAPGLLYDRVRADALAAGVPIAAPLTTPDSEPPPELIDLVLARYAAAIHAQARREATAAVGIAATTAAAAAA